MEAAAASGSGAPSSGTAGDSKDVAMESAAPAEEEEDEDIRNSSAEELLMKSRMLDTEIKVGMVGVALCCRTSSRPARALWRSAMRRQWLARPHHDK